MRLRVGARTDTGRVRGLNEDAYAARAEQGLFVVCDGMGGAPAGEVASQLALDAILEQFDAAPPSRGTASGGSDADAPGHLRQTGRLADAVRRSNQRVYEHAMSDPERAGMGTTVVSACVGEHIASVAHVGDSRAYLWHRGRLEPLTSDHALWDSSVLIRVLGREPEVDVDLAEVFVQPGDYLLLCSDGLTRMVSDDVVASAIGKLRDPQRICDYLIETANENGGADNITVVVVHVTEAWWCRALRPLAWIRRTRA